MVQKIIIINIHDMCWGDAIGKVWIYQYLSAKIKQPQKYPELQNTDLWINDYWGITKYLQLPEPQVTLPSTRKTYDEYYQVITHHRHWWFYGYPDSILNQNIFYKNRSHQTVRLQGSHRIWKPMFWDISGLFVRFRIEKYTPPFIPTQTLETELQALLQQHQIPYTNKLVNQNWIVCHFHDNYPDTFDRTRYDLSTFCKSFSLPTTSPIILSTDAHLTVGMFQKSPQDQSRSPRIINLKNINPWLKLYLMVLSKETYTFHSGFSSIAGIYTQNPKIHVVNTNPSSTVMTGPPIVAYANAKFQINSTHQQELEAHVDSTPKFNNPHSYLKWLYQDQSVRYFMYHGLYETLQYYPTSKPDQSAPSNQKDQKISFTRENCLVPYTAQFGLSSPHQPTFNINLRTILPNHEYLWGSDFMKAEMRRFPLLIETLLGIPFQYYQEIQERIIEDEHHEEENGRIRLYKEEGG